VLNLRPLLNPEWVVINCYGPAECAVAASCYTVGGEEVQNHIGLPIGRPLAYTKIYILDEFLQEVIPGQTGEIVIGGTKFSSLLHISFDFYQFRVQQILYTMLILEILELRRIDV
jgi:non-ribosomal peptide synthetase component F